MRKREAFSFSLLFQTTLRCVQNVLNPFNLTYQKATHLQHLAVCNYWSNLGHEAFFLSCFLFFVFFYKNYTLFKFFICLSGKTKDTTVNIIFSALFICLQFNAPFVVTIIHIIFSSVCCKMQLFVNALSKLLPFLILHFLHIPLQEKQCIVIHIRQYCCTTKLLQ